jgi:hypothetical protein
MGLVRNLKKTLSNLAEKILVELSYHYIKQRAKQTLKRQDNSLEIMSSQKDLTTERQGTTIATSSTGTSEKIIMETMTEPVVQIRDWSIDRIHHLADAGGVENQFNAVAIAEEFDEWINIPDGARELDYLCLEREDGFGDQEIDVR